MSSAKKIEADAAQPAKPAAKPIKTGAKPKRSVGAAKRRARNDALPQARVPVDDALRAAGLGELRFAETLGLFIERVSDKKGQEKLLLDGLKEWGRQFERTRPPERASDPPMVVQLIHNVPRPERSERPPAPKLPAELPPAPDPQGPPKPPPLVQ
jgi:hypothetical protein